jgi:hypothetical protein
MIIRHENIDELEELLVGIAIYVLQQYPIREGPIVKKYNKLWKDKNAI